MGARTDQRCSICAANEDVRAAVEQARRNGRKLDALARDSGFSRAALSRHFLKHVLRETLAQHREMKLNMHGKKIITQWPTATPGLFHLTTVEQDAHGRSTLRHLTAEDAAKELSNCVLFVVDSDQPVTPRILPPSLPEENPELPN